MTGSQQDMFESSRQITQEVPYTQPLLLTYTIYLCFLIGVIKLVCLFYHAVKNILYYATRKRRDLYKVYGIERTKDFNGTYAVVTGASDGIGLAYCKHLAMMGFNILMISRSEERLKKARQEVLDHIKNEQLKVDVDYIAQDLSKLTTYQDYIDKLGKKLSEIDIGILINNAGIGFTGPYSDMSDKEAEAVLSLNCFHPVYLAKLLLPQQLNRSKKSALVGVSSLMGYHAFPCHTYYSSSKIFVRHLYEGLNTEMQLDKRTQGKIDFQCYKPGFVATKLSRKSKGCTIPDTMKAAEGALMDLGKRQTDSYGVIDHHFVAWLMKFGIYYFKGLLNYCFMLEGTMTNKKLRGRNHTFI